MFVTKKLDPFEIFFKLTSDSKKELKYLNDDESYSYLFNELKDVVDEKEFLDCIKLDYLLKNKMKPKIWWDYEISKENRNKYFKLFNQQYNIDSITYYNYSIVDIINNNVYLFTYKDNKVTYLKIKNPN